MHLRSCIGIVPLLLWAVGCATNSGDGPRWAEAPEVDLASYETYAWEDRTGAPPATILDNRIRDALRGELEGKGYRESAESPDFVLQHETIESEAVQEGRPLCIGIGLGSWGGRVGGSVGTSVDVGGQDRVRQEQRIAVRVLDPEAQRELWVGTTVALSERPEPEAIERALAALMAAFPDRAPERP